MNIMNPIGAQRYGNPYNNRIKSTAKMVKNMKLSLEQLQALNAINMLNEDQKAELKRLEAENQDAPVEHDEFNFETQTEAKELFDKKVAFTQKILPEFENETDRDDLVLTAMATCSGADTKNDMLLVVPDQLKKQFARAIGSQSFGFVYSQEKLMSGIVKNKLMADPKHKPAIALYEKDLPNPFRPHTKDELEFLGHQILITSNADIGLSKLNPSFIGTKEYNFKEGDYAYLPSLDDDSDIKLGREKSNLRWDQKAWFKENRELINERTLLIAEAKCPENVELELFIPFCLKAAYASFISKSLFKSVLEDSLKLAAETLKDNESLFLEAAEDALLKFESLYKGEKNISTKMLAHLINDAHVSGLKTLGHIKVASYLDDINIQTEKLPCFHVGSSAVRITELKIKMAELKAA